MLLSRINHKRTKTLQNKIYFCLNNIFQDFYREEYFFNSYIDSLKWHIIGEGQVGRRDQSFAPDLYTFR